MLSIELKDFGNKSDLKICVQILNTVNKTTFSANISGNLSNIDFPEISNMTLRKNELWTIGCFEIFVSKKDNSYTEYNFGFDRNFEIFNFSDYRVGQNRPEVEISPEITCKTNDELFTQFVEFSQNIIFDNFFSVTAVVKLSNGDFLYFANKHCGQKPDFHLKESRILKI